MEYGKYKPRRLWLPYPVNARAGNFPLDGLLVRAGREAGAQLADFIVAAACAHALIQASFDEAIGPSVHVELIRVVVPDRQTVV